MEINKSNSQNGFSHCCSIEEQDFDMSNSICHSLSYIARRIKYDLDTDKRIQERYSLLKNKKQGE